MAMACPEAPWSKPLLLDIILGFAREAKIMEAFKRNAELDANRITVEANGSEVILKGTVRSWIEREEAERVAWSAPGITKVEDRIVVSP
jgi:osmotically-inducible protein OsmY